MYTDEGINFIEAYTFLFIYTTRKRQVDKIKMKIKIKNKNKAGTTIRKRYVIKIKMENEKQPLEDWEMVVDKIKPYFIVIMTL